MLSVTAAGVLAVADSTTLKHPPSILPSCLTPTDDYTSSTWAPDNSLLYLSSARQVFRYDPSSSRLSTLHTLEGDRIKCLLAKDNSTAIFSAGRSIYLVECGGPTVEVTEIFHSRKAEILSLSLSNDSTLLASASHNAVYVHDLELDSHVTLQGISPLERATLCAFHPHTRTRLLVATGKHILVYDTSRPFSPAKTFSMGEAAPGDIVAFASSPFSKTLVAIATSSGHVGLVDLDKDKGLFRALNLKESLTTIAFSPEGAAIYFGTESGKLLIQDLRSLDKVPKSIVVSELGNPIHTLAVQKKLKNPPEDWKVKSSQSISVRKTAATATKVSPSQTKSIRSGSVGVATPARRTLLHTGTPKRSPSLKTTMPKNVLSPSRNPQGNSLALNTPRLVGKTAIAKAKQSSLSSSSPFDPKSRRTPGKSTMPSESTPRATSTRPRKMSISQLIEPSITTQLEMTTSASVSTTFNNRERPRFRTSTSTSLVPPKSGTTAASRPRRSGSPVSTSSVTSRPKHTSPPHAPPVPSPLVNVITSPPQPSSIPKIHENSRTPSPDLPDMKMGQKNFNSTPKKTRMAVLGLGTPEMKAWIKNGQGSKTAKDKARAESLHPKYPGDHGSTSDEDEDDERQRKLSMQISPRRPLPTGSPPRTTQSHAYSQSWDASPLRPRNPGHTAGSPSAGNAHDLLKSIVQDVMYDYQKETKAEMMGLHLDLVRMGRGWKQELRSLMEEYVGDLSDLREENRRLREGNDRLKRGY